MYCTCSCIPVVLGYHWPIKHGVVVLCMDWLSGLMLPSLVLSECTPGEGREGWLVSMLWAYVVCRRTVWLSTAPFQPLTHWYQVSWSTVVRYAQCAYYKKSCNIYNQRHQRKIKKWGERLKWCALRALRVNLINMHAQKQPYIFALGGAAHAVFRLMQLVDRFRVVKLSHAATTTGY